MSTANSRQRKVQQPKAVKDEGQRAGEEEESIIKGLLPCVAGVGGVAIALWVVVYLYAYVPPHNGGHGQDIVHVCTPVKDIHEVQVGLEGVTTWEVLGQALRVEQTVLDHIQMNSQSESDKTNKVLRSWFESGKNTCWEEVIHSLQEIGKKELAEKLAAKYHTTI